MPAPRHVTLTPPPRRRRSPSGTVLLVALLITSLAAAALQWQLWQALDAYLDVEAAMHLPATRPEVRQ